MASTQIADRQLKTGGLVFTDQVDTNYTLALTDANKGINMSSSTDRTLTVPPNSSVAFPVGTQIVIEIGGTGSVIIAPGSGVTLEGEPLTISGQYSTFVLIKKAVNTWLVTSSVPQVNNPLMYQIFN